MFALPGCEPADHVAELLGTRLVRGLQVGGVRDGRVGRTDPLHGRGQFVEEFFGDPRLEFGAETGPCHRLVEHDSAAGLAD